MLWTLRARHTCIESWRQTESGRELALYQQPTGHTQCPRKPSQGELAVWRWKRMRSWYQSQVPERKMFNLPGGGWHFFPPSRTSTGSYLFPLLVYMVQVRLTLSFTPGMSTWPRPSQREHWFPGPWGLVQKRTGGPTLPRGNFSGTSPESCGRGITFLLSSILGQCRLLLLKNHVGKACLKTKVTHRKENLKGPSWSCLFALQDPGTPTDSCTPNCLIMSGHEFSERAIIWIRILSFTVKPSC